VQRVHVINGRVDEGLLAEVFSNEGIGTLIYANEYQQIRPAKKKDVRAIQLLTDKGVQTDELVKRTRASIEKHLEDYYIFEIDKNPVACVLLANMAGEPPVYVSPAHENRASVASSPSSWKTGPARWAPTNSSPSQLKPSPTSKARALSKAPDDLLPSCRETPEWPQSSFSKKKHANLERANLHSPSTLAGN
jgi:hypothetical protein